MGNKIKAIPEKAEEILDKVVETFGIETIKKYVNNYNRKNRKKQKRHNTREEVVKDILELIVNQGYNRTKATEKVADKRNIEPKTANNHLTAFYKEAKQNNFFTYGFIYKKMEDYFLPDGGHYDYYSAQREFYEAVKEFCEINEIEEEKLYLYFLRYKSLIPKEKKKYQLNFSNIKPIDLFMDIEALRKYYPELEEKKKQKDEKIKELEKLKEKLDITDDEIPF